MRCTDKQNLIATALAPLYQTTLRLTTVLAALLMAGCASKQAPAPFPAPAPAAPAAPSAAASPAARPATPAAPTPAPMPGTAAAAPVPAAPPGMRIVKLPPPTPSRNMAEVRLQAARRLVAAHPDGTYMSTPRQPLLGIPVLKVTLNVDGSVNNILVLREPQEAKETIQRAIDAVRRAAPYGDLSRVPRPWEFVETFLFENNGRFKPMTLDR